MTNCALVHWLHGIARANRQTTTQDKPRAGNLKSCRFGPRVTLQTRLLWRHRRSDKASLHVKLNIWLTMTIDDVQLAKRSNKRCALLKFCFNIWADHLDWICFLNAMMDKIVSTSHGDRSISGIHPCCHVGSIDNDRDFAPRPKDPLLWNPRKDRSHRHGVDGGLHSRHLGHHKS